MVAVGTKTIVDGDGHIMEDLEAMAGFLPPKFRDHPARRLNSTLFPPLDHLHQGHFVETPGRRDRQGKFVGPDGWDEFLDDLGIRATVLYPTTGLSYGRIVNRDWAVAVAQAYNDWLHQTYVKRSPRYQGMGLIPLQDPQAAVEELRRCVQELGFRGAMVPSFGLPDHLASKLYWPVYEEADRLGCCIAVHGGCHGGIGLDHMNIYAPIHAIGHPLGQMIALGGFVFNGLFDKFPNMRVAFLEGGVAWFLMCLERFDRSHETHIEYNLRDDEIPGPKEGDKPSEYIQRHIDERRLFIGCEGEEPAIGYAVSVVGSAPFIFSTDFPHEVTAKSCRHEIEEILENTDLGDEHKEDILHRNAEAFYRL